MLPTIRKFESVTFIAWSREIGLSYNMRDFEMLLAEICQGEEHRIVAFFECRTVNQYPKFHGLAEVSSPTAILKASHPE
jgi:hypothetical protein